MNFSEIKILFLVGIRQNQNLVRNYRLYQIIEIHFLHQISLRTVLVSVAGTHPLSTLIFIPQIHFLAYFIINVLGYPPFSDSLLELFYFYAMLTVECRT